MDIDVLKRTISILEKEIIRNNEESDKTILSLDESLAKKNTIIRNLKNKISELEVENEQLKKKIILLDKRKKTYSNDIADFFFGS